MANASGSSTKQATADAFDISPNANPNSPLGRGPSRPFAAESR